MRNEDQKGFSGDGEVLRCALEDMVQVQGVQ